MRFSSMKEYRRQNDWQSSIAISQMKALTEDHRILQLEAAEGAVTEQGEDIEPDTKD